MMGDIFKNKKNIVAAFFGCWAIQLAIGITVRNPLTVVFFVFILWAGAYVETRGKELSKAKVVYRTLLSVFISAMITVFSFRKVTAAFSSGLFKALSVGILLLGFFLTGLLLSGVLSATKIPVKHREGTGRNYEPSNIKQILMVMGICLLCWLPFFLYEFPGIMTADSLVQYSEIYATEPWSNHHPVIHTLLIWLFTKIGFLFTDNRSVSVAFYTAFQMIFMAYCCGVCICHIKGKKGKILASCFFALAAFNGVFVVTIWKDIIFAAVTMLLVCKLLDLSDDRRKSRISDWILFGAYAFLFALFRANAWYALILWTPFFIYGFRKDIKKAVVYLAAVFILVIIAKGPLISAFGVAQPGFVESLSVPTQQIARVLVEEAEIPRKDYELISAVMDTSYVNELYCPEIGDNIKELIKAGHPEVIENNKGVYLGLWARTVRRHPVITARAWFDMLGGYIYPDVPYNVADADGIMGNSLGLQWTPLIGGKIVVKGKEILIKLGSFVPLYGMLWSIGAYTWLLVIVIILSIKNKGEVLSKLLLLMLIASLLIAAPLVDFRYGYAVVMTMPVWVMGIFEKRNSYERAD